MDVYAEVKKTNMEPFIKDSINWVFCDDNVSMEMFQISNSEAVIFANHEMSGMVGESHMWTTATKVDIHGLGSTEILQYEHLREIYRTLQGKKKRQRFWGQMRTMSEEYRNKESERSRQEAISIVI